VTRRELIAAGFGAALIGKPNAWAPEVWIMPPPWPGNGRCLWEMATREDEWAEARSLAHGLGYWPWILNQFCSDEQLRTIFARLRAWKIGFGLEVPVYKGAGWGYDAKPLDASGAFSQNRMFEERFLRAGMPAPRWFAFDEPVYAARHPAPRHADAAARLKHGAEETAKFIGLMRRAHPRARLGDIEPYPALSVDEITGAVTSIQVLCKDARVRGLDFLRLDVDWSLFAGGSGSWADVKRIEEFCRSRRMRFSLIYWASEQPRLSPERRSDPMVWRDGVLRQAAQYAAAGGRPDEVVVESWLHVPQHAVPELDPTTFASSVVEFCRALNVSGRVGRGYLRR